MDINLTLTSNGKVLEISGKSNAAKQYQLLDISGTSASEYEVEILQSANLDGGTLQNVRLAPREVEIAFHIRKQYAELDRQQVISFFNPKKDVTLVVDRCGLRRKIVGRVSQFNIAQENLYLKQRVTVTLLCKDPYFLDMNNFGRNIAGITPMFRFPLGIVAGVGQIMGYKTLSKQVVINNTGDVPTGIVAEFVAQRGTVTNPKLTNVVTGEFLEIIDEMAHGETIVMSTMERAKRIDKDGTNTTQKMNRMSTFFELAVGENLISYDADANYINLDVYIYYTPKYLGI